jgi:3-hydroxybutyryl-CoA dehydrogenase
VERDEESAQAARARVESAVLKSIERGTTDHYNPEVPTSKLTVGVDYDRSIDRYLVVEAVPEDRDLKVTAL